MVSDPFFRGEAGDSGLLLLNDSLLRDAAIDSGIGLFMLKLVNCKSDGYTRGRTDGSVLPVLSGTSQNMRRTISLMIAKQN